MMTVAGIQQTVMAYAILEVQNVFRSHLPVLICIRRDIPSRLVVSSRSRIRLNGEGWESGREEHSGSTDAQAEQSMYKGYRYSQQV